MWYNNVRLKDERAKNIKGETMKVFLNRIDGLDDAIISMFLSKRTLTRELEREIREEVKNCKSDNGELKEVTPKLRDWLTKLFKWGRTHITMLRFVDLSFMVYGLHRGGQDDFDSHSMRLNNRIIRSSTRLADFSNGEMSEFYKGNILPTDQALVELGIELPNEITHNGETFVKCVNGYIKKELKDNKDYKRGLYMLSIPSDFIFRCNLTEFAHIYKERGKHSSANGELKECVEQMCDELTDGTLGYINRDLLMNVKN